MSSWGQAFGGAWGDSWGSVGVAAAAAGNTAYGVGRNKRKGVRLTVNINGENVLVSSVEEAQALLKAQTHPKERIRRRRHPKARIIERLRPDIPVSEQVEALGQNFGEIADAAVRNADVVRLFNDAVTQQSIAALGALRMGIESAQNQPESVFTPPEVKRPDLKDAVMRLFGAPDDPVTPEDEALAGDLQRQVEVFDKALGIFLKGISEKERQLYREADRRMEQQRKKFDAFKKVFK